MLDMETGERIFPEMRTRRGPRTVTRELAPVAGVEPPVNHHTLLAEHHAAGGPYRYREFVVFHGSHVYPECACDAAALRELRVRVALRLGRSAPSLAPPPLMLQQARAIESLAPVQIWSRTSASATRSGRCGEKVAPCFVPSLKWV
jgi:hypothetical protein